MFMRVYGYVRASCGKAVQDEALHFSLVGHPCKRNPTCACNSGIENDGHILLHCPIYDLMRNDLLGYLSKIPGIELGNLSSETLL